MPPVSYDQAQKNLQAGGLSGADLSTAQGVLADAYKTPTQSNMPTVLTNTGIIEDKIPKLNQQLSSFVPPEQPTKADEPADPLGDYFNATYGTDETDPSYALEDKLISKLQAGNDAASAAYIDAIKNQFASQRDTLQQSQAGNRASEKNALLRSGTSRYAPTVASGILSQENRADIAELGKLQTNENLSIAQAMQAKQQNDYQLLEKQLGTIKDIRAEKQAKAKAVYDDMVKKQETNQKNIDDIVKSLGENGAPAEVISAVSQSQDLGEAVENAGDYLAKGSGTVGEYLYYKRDAIAHGQVPLTYNEYADMDANRKRSVTNISMGGLTNQQAQLATKLSDDYEQRSTDFYKLRSGYNQVVSSASDPTGAGDISLLYGYMKMLDPNSVVRETEFATAQNAGSIPENIRAKYNAAVNGKKLSDAQRTDFINQAQKVYTSAKKQQDDVKSEFDSRADKYGVPADLVTRSTDATGSALIQQGADAKQRVLTAVQASPQTAAVIRPLIAQGLSDQDIMLALPEYFK